MDLVASFNCKICRQFENQISSTKGFNYTWIKWESKQFLLNTVKEQAEGKPHKKAFDIIFKIWDSIYVNILKQCIKMLEVLPMV